MSASRVHTSNKNMESLEIDTTVDPPSKKARRSKLWTFAAIAVLFCVLASLAVFFLIDFDSSSTAEHGSGAPSPGEGSLPTSDSMCEEGDFICQSNNIAYDHLKNLSDACESDDSCFAAISASLTTGVRLNVSTPPSETDEYDEIADLNQISSRRYLRLENEINSLPSFDIYDSRHRSLNAADNCSLTRLQELSEMFQQNIAQFRDSLMEKKAELSAAAMVVVRTYRERYAEKTAAMENESWVKVTSDEADEAWKSAANESVSSRENVKRIRDELAVMAHDYSKEIAGYVDTIRSMKLCRRNALGLPPPTNKCDSQRLDEYDALANEPEEMDEIEASEDGVTNGIKSIHETNALESISQSNCTVHDDLLAAVDGMRGELACQFRWVMRTVSRMLREAKTVLVHYSSWMRKCGGSNRNERSTDLEAYCVRVGSEMDEARNRVRYMMRKARKNGKMIMEQNRRAATILQIKQRCKLNEITGDEFATVAVASESACGPLAPISIGNVLDTIEPLVDSDDPLNSEAYRTLKTEVSVVSAKLFCLAEDLKGRIPIRKAINLLTIYKQLVRDCPAEYLRSRALCGAEYSINIGNMTKASAKTVRKACIQEAKDRKRRCSLELSPKVASLRSEISADMRDLNSAARDAWRWIEMKAKFLQPQYDALLTELRGHIERYENLTKFKQLQRGLLAESLTSRRHLVVSNEQTEDDSIEGRNDLDSQMWFMRLAGMGDLVEEEDSIDDENVSLARIGDRIMSNDAEEDDESYDEDFSDFDEWLLAPPSWLQQCPDICVPGCCPRQGCVRGCRHRTSCTGSFLRNMTQTQVCYSCLTSGCEGTSNSLPSTCIQFDASDGGTNGTGAHPPPEEASLSFGPGGPTDGIVSYGPMMVSASRPESYQVLIKSISLCRNLTCDGTVEGPRSVEFEGETQEITCVKGQYGTIPSQCIRVYENSKYGTTEFPEIENSAPRLSTDGSDLVADESSQCGQVRALQRGGLYVDLADPAAVMRQIGGASGFLLREQDLGEYNFVSVDLAGDYIIRASVPLTSGDTLHTQPCGCDTCPNDKNDSSTLLSQPNPDVMCGGGGCSSCDRTARTNFSASNSAMMDELGVQTKMCANDLREGPASEVTIRQSAKMQFVLNKPFTLKRGGIEVLREFQQRNGTRARRHVCLKTSADWLGVSWDDTIYLSVESRSDLLASASDLIQRRRYRAASGTSFGHIGTQIWIDANPQCASWIENVFAGVNQSGASCEVAYNGAIAAVENLGNVTNLEELASTVLRDLMKSVLDSCATNVRIDDNSQNVSDCIRDASESFGRNAAGRIRKRMELVQQYRGGLLANTSTTMPIDFADAFGDVVCGNLTSDSDRAFFANDRVRSKAMTIDLMYVLDGTIRAHVAPNRFDYDHNSGEYILSDSDPLQATRTMGAISDGMNAILVDDVQLSAIIRMEGESLLRYRQVVTVDRGCEAVQAGHPCIYPTADFRSVTDVNDPDYRTSPCQRPAEHGGRWRDTNVNMTGITISKPFKLLIDTYYVGVEEASVGISRPSSFRDIRGVSVRAVHAGCAIGNVGLCPQDQRLHCTSKLPFETHPINRIVESAGVMKGELRSGLEGTPGGAGLPRSSLSGEDADWIIPPEADAFDFLGITAEYLLTAIVKDFKPLENLGDSYSSLQVLVHGQQIPMASRRGDTDGPGGTQFENYGMTSMYFRCPATLTEIETVRGPFSLQ